MTITLDAVTAEMLKAIMKKEGKYDGKKYLSEYEKVMDMVRLSLSNGETLEEVAECMFNIQKAAKLIAGEQREELVNT